jgi:hypothetical protein
LLTQRSSNGISITIKATTERNRENRSASHSIFFWPLPFLISTMPAASVEMQHPVTMSPPPAANVFVHHNRLNGTQPASNAHANSVAIMPVSQYARLRSTAGQQPASGMRTGIFLKRRRILIAFLWTAALKVVLMRRPAIPSIEGLLSRRETIGCTTITLDLGEVLIVLMGGARSYSFCTRS